MSIIKSPSDREMAEASDNPELTDEEFARAQSLATAFPDLFESCRDGIQIVRTVPPSLMYVALRGDIADYYASFGEEAEARLNADLRKVAGLPS